MLRIPLQQWNSYCKPNVHTFSCMTITLTRPLHIMAWLSQPLQVYIQTLLCLISPPNLSHIHDALPNSPFLPAVTAGSSANFSDLRRAVKSFRHLKQDSPRIRIRTLDIIPLALHLPRTAPLELITQTLSPTASLSIWIGLSTLNPTACCFLETLFQFFEQKHSSLHKRIPPLLTWNPSSLATIHQGPSPKMCLILKRARSHICFIQETNWSTVQYNHVALSAPFCLIYHSPATGEGSSGVATFLPHPLTASSHSIITPGYLLTISTSIGGLSVELINVYLHPRKISQLGSSLLAHLRSEHSRSHDLRFIGGDLNQINTKVPNLYQQIIMELNCIPAPTLPTYRLPNGYTSPLDAFLLQTTTYYNFDTWSHLGHLFARFAMTS